VLLELDSIATKEKFLNHTGVGSWFTIIKQASDSFKSDERIIWGEVVEWEDTNSKSLSCKHLCLKTKSDVSINGRRKIIVQGKVFWIRAKEMDAWTPTFHDDPHDESQDDGMEDVADDKEANGLSDIERVSESSFMQVNVLAQENSNNSKIGDVDTQSEDPFNLYEMLNGHHKKASNASKDEPEFPPGFTPINNEGEHIAEESLHAINEQIQSLSSKLKERKINGR
ncbi:hypothetical protein Tco_0182118, partial [Tanacetum coccineum]